MVTASSEFNQSPWGSESQKVWESALAGFSFGTASFRPDLKYELDRLGWIDFEELVQALLIARLGPGVESWGGSGDWGRDAYCESPLRYPGKKLERGPFLIQCKFVVAANAAGAKPEKPLLAAVEKECERILKRIAEGIWANLPRHYLLFTNAPAKGKTRHQIKSLLRAALPNTVIHIHHGRDICNWIDLTPQIVLRFPQLFTVTDLTLFLEEMVHASVLTRSKVAIEMAREMATVFVPTGAYYEALEKLHNHRFVVLEGPPEMGKTTIGRIIALAQLRQGWDAIECKKPTDFYRAHKPRRRQVFIADDCFGRNDYEVMRVSRWQDELPYILRKLDAGHWLVLTSRAHLLQMAKQQLDVSGCNEVFPRLGEVLVNAGKLTQLEKAKILYRHAKAAGLPQPMRLALRNSARDIADNKHFTPLRIKRLIQSLAKGSGA